MIYDSIAILILANTARFLFVANCGLASSLKDLHPGLEEAALVAGVPWWRQLVGLFLPLCAPAVVAVWGLCFLFSFAEVDASVLLCPPGCTTLPVRLFSLMHYGPGRYVAALSMLTVIIILAAAAVTAKIYQAAKEHIDARR
jgi:ABC-type Fe3+ transport system permease subunit